MAKSSLAKSELLALLRTAKERRERDWLMILVAYNHGLRASEVVGLTGDCVRDGWLTVKRLKGSLRTVQPLMGNSNPLLDETPALISLIKGAKSNARIFPIARQHFWRLVQRYAREAGIPSHKSHPHILKHTIALQIIGKAGIENTRQWLGHKSISSTGEYLRVTDESAGRAVERALGSR
jgi:integrase/recombinase XerD